MAGFGKAPFGKAPFGRGTPIAAPSSLGAPLSDETGRILNGRYIDPRTRRYSFLGGRAKGMSTAQQTALLTLLTLEGSSAQAALGTSAPGGVIGQNFAAERRAEIVRAFEEPVKSGALELLSVEVNATSRPVYTVIRFRDPVTGRDFEERT